MKIEDATMVGEKGGSTGCFAARDVTDEAIFEKVVTRNADNLIHRWHRKDWDLRFAFSICVACGMSLSRFVELPRILFNFISLLSK